MKIPITAGEPIVLTIRLYGNTGAREMEAVFDTGASFLTIPPEDALDIGYDLAGLPKVTVATANAVIEAPKVILSRVKVGEYLEMDVPAICLDIAAGGVSSLLGLSLIERFNVTIDSKRGLLTLTKS